MTNCLNCGAQNLLEADRCAKCGQSLAVAPGSGDPELLVTAGKVYTAAPSPEMLVCARRARYFVLLFVLALLIVAAVPVLRWSYGIDLLGRMQSGIPLAAWAAVYGWLLHAYLVGSTAQSTGMSFWPSFLLALVPPLVPTAWARIGQARWWKPYVFLAVTLGFSALFTSLAHGAEWAIQVACMAAIPFLISIWFGGSVTLITRILGINPYLGGLWLCIIPALLGGFVLADLDFISIFENVRKAGTSFGQSLTTVVQYLDFQSLPAELLILCAIWSGLTLLLWIKAIHDNLRFPIFN